MSKLDSVGLNNKTQVLSAQRKTAVSSLFWNWLCLVKIPTITTSFEVIADRKHNVNVIWQVCAELLSRSTTVSEGNEVKSGLVALLQIHHITGRISMKMMFTRKKGGKAVIKGFFVDAGHESLTDVAI